MESHSKKSKRQSGKARRQTDTPPTTRALRSATTLSAPPPSLRDEPSPISPASSAASASHLPTVQEAAPPTPGTSRRPASKRKVSERKGPPTRPDPTTHLKSKANNALIPPAPRLGTKRTRRSAEDPTAPAESSSSAAKRRTVSRPNSANSVEVTPAMTRQSKRKGKAKAFKPDNDAAPAPTSTTCTKNTPVPLELQKGMDGTACRDHSRPSTPIPKVDHSVVNEQDGDEEALFSYHNVDSDHDSDEDSYGWGDSFGYHAIDEEGEDEDEDRDDDDDDDDDDDSGDDMGDFHNESLSFMRRGFGLRAEDTFGRMSDRFMGILNHLRDHNNRTQQFVALQDLAETLSISSEDTLSGLYTCDTLVKELVKILKGSAPSLEEGDMDDDLMLAIALSSDMNSDPELMLLACRCITNMLEVRPSTIHSVVSCGTIQVLCDKLKSIQYIDLAEQALCALDKIASQMPHAVVREEGLEAVVTHFDFFSIPSWRTALRTVSHCMKNIGVDALDQVLKAIPTLSNTLTNSDREVVELTCNSWARLAESYSRHQASFDKVMSAQVLKTLISLFPVSGNPTAVRPRTFLDILTVMRAVSQCSPNFSSELLKLDIIGTFYQILTGAPDTPPSSMNESITVHTLDVKWSDSFSTILEIIVDLLPPLPKNGIFSQTRFNGSEPVALRTRSARANDDTDVENTGDDEDESNHGSSSDSFVSMFNQETEMSKRIGYILVPVLLEVYQSTVDSSTRKLVTCAMMKLVYFLNEETLQHVLSDVPLSSFLAGILAQQERPLLVMDALWQVELLMTKLFDIYCSLFEREGVMHEIEALSRQPLQATIGTSSNSSQESNRGLNHDGISQGLTRTHSSLSYRNNNMTDEERQMMLGIFSLSASRRGRRPKSGLHEGEKGIGQGQTRHFIIRLAQHLADIHQKRWKRPGTPRQSNLEELRGLAHSLASSEAKDPTCANALSAFVGYLDRSRGTASSFELDRSGMVNALFNYLTIEDVRYCSPLPERHHTFRAVFCESMRVQDDKSSVSSTTLTVLVQRLHELLSRFEHFEVTLPIEESSGDSLRNPVNMLVKQLRLNLKGKGDDIPRNYKHFMISTHAVATFKVLEEFLLSPERGLMGNEEDFMDEDDYSMDDEEMMDLGMDRRLSGKRSGDATRATENKKTGSARSEDGKATSSKNPSAKNIASGDRAGRWAIQFFIKGKEIPIESTVYGAVHTYTDHLSGHRNFWSNAFPVDFKRVWVPHPLSGAIDQSLSLAHRFTNIERPVGMAEDDVCLKVLNLLKALSSLVNGWDGLSDGSAMVPDTHFVNRKLAAKMNQQLEEPLIVASACLPEWVFWSMQKYPFLFPFETRYLFLQSTSFGYARLIARWQNMQVRSTQNSQQRDGGQQPMLGRMERKKIKVKRSQMLEYAIKILKEHGRSSTVIEIEYDGEEGTGLGPTLEFYATTSKEFCKRTTGMWHNDGEDAPDSLVSAKQGLFPISLSKVTSAKSQEKIIQLFKSLGQFVAKAMLDFRIIDIPFSAAFFKTVLNTDYPTLPLLKEIDPMMGRSVTELKTCVDQKRAVEADLSLSRQERAKAVQDITLQGNRIEDLCLYFTLPDNAEVFLKPGGSNIPVTIDNVEEYVELLVDALVGKGIEKQVTAFREGFDELFAIDNLKILTCEELVSLFGMTAEDWSYATLSDAIKADHGFTMESDAVKYLLEILSEMTVHERREFLQFATGSPRLPIGGWKAMRPVFTVVRTHCSPPLTADDYLPSVMTCANYLKMPEYTSKDVMRQKLLQSAQEGKNSFLLS